MLLPDSYHCISTSTAYVALASRKCQNTRTMSLLFTCCNPWNAMLFWAVGSLRTMDCITDLTRKRPQSCVLQQKTAVILHHTLFIFWISSLHSDYKSWNSFNFFQYWLSCLARTLDIRRIDRWNPPWCTRMVWNTFLELTMLRITRMVWNTFLELAMLRIHAEI